MLAPLSSMVATTALSASNTVERTHMLSVRLLPESATTSRHTERASVPESSVNVNESAEAVIHRGGHRGGSVGGAAGVGDGRGHAGGRTGIGIAGSLQTRALASSSRGGGDAHAKSARDSAGDSRQAALALWTEQRSEVAALSVRESIPLSIDWKRQTLAYASCHDLCQILVAVD